MNGSHESVAKRVNGHHGAVNGAGAIETLRSQHTELVDELAQAMGMARDSLERPAATPASALHAPSPTLPAMPPPRHFFDDEDDDASMPIPSTWRNPPEPSPPTRTFADQLRSAVLGFGVGLAIIVPTVLLMTGRLDDIDIASFASMIPGVVTSVQESARAPAPVPPAVQQRTVATTTMVSPVTAPPPIIEKPAPAVEQPARPIETARVEPPVVKFTPPVAPQPTPAPAAPAAITPPIATPAPVSAAPATPEPTAAPEPAAVTPPPQVATPPAPAPVPPAPTVTLPTPAPQIAALPVAPPAEIPRAPTPAAIAPEPVAPPAAPARAAPDTTSTSPWASIVSDSRQRIRSGDVAGGRQLLSRPVAAEDPEAIMALAETFDPNMLAAWGVMASADVATARRLYAKALSGGIEMARSRLKGLE